VQASVVEPVDVLGDGDLEVVEALPEAIAADSSALNSELNASARALSWLSSVEPTEATPPASAIRWV
jgi:hypothetical protein